KLYALTLSIIFFSRINDCCSGIRLFHRSAILPYLEHLPDGLDFTPAMTIFMKKLKIKFLEMKVPYHERLGESKLSVIKDGFRFWHTIFRFSFLYDYHSISTATREWR